MTKFEVQRLDWYKRRKPGEHEKREIESFEVMNFEKTPEHRCEVMALIDGRQHEFVGRVYARETYHKTAEGLKKILHGWSVHAIDHQGNALLLKLIEN